MRNYGVTELRSYGIMELRNYGVTELRIRGLDNSMIREKIKKRNEEKQIFSDGIGGYCIAYCGLQW